MAIMAAITSIRLSVLPFPMAWAPRMRPVGTSNTNLKFMYKAALVGLNLLNGCYRQAPVTAVRQLVESEAYIVDVREEQEFKAGHLKGARNIPLSQLRQRIHADKG